VARDAVKRGYDVVVAAGGDGSIGLVGRQLLDSQTTLGILPLGSIMNISRMLGLPRDLEAAVAILHTGYVRPVDVGQVGDRIFYEAGSVGLHAATSRDIARVDDGDYGAIIRSAVAAFRYRPSRMTIELDDDRTIETRALLVAGRQRTVHWARAGCRTGGLHRRRALRRVHLPPLLQA
jgi:diacylglycerol kinase (ATP)